MEQDICMWPSVVLILLQSQLGPTFS